jgi:hypothetical protein
MTKNFDTQSPPRCIGEDDYFLKNFLCVFASLRAKKIYR